MQALRRSLTKLRSFRPRGEGPKGGFFGEGHHEPGKSPLPLHPPPSTQAGCCRGTGAWHECQHHFVLKLRCLEAPAGRGGVGLLLSALRLAEGSGAKEARGGHRGN